MVSSSSDSGLSCTISDGESLSVGSSVLDSDFFDTYFFSSFCFW